MLSNAMLSTLVAIQWDLYAMIIPTIVVFSISLFGEIYTDGQDLDQRTHQNHSPVCKENKWPIKFTTTYLQYDISIKCWYGDKP